MKKKKKRKTENRRKNETIRDFVLLKRTAETETRKHKYEPRKRTTAVLINRTQPGVKSTINAKTMGGMIDARHEMDSSSIESYLVVTSLRPESTHRTKRSKSSKHHNSIKQKKSKSEVRIIYIYIYTAV